MTFVVQQSGLIIVHFVKSHYITLHIHYINIYTSTRIYLYITFLYIYICYIIISHYTFNIHIHIYIYMCLFTHPMYLPLFSLLHYWGWVTHTAVTKCVWPPTAAWQMWSPDSCVNLEYVFHQTDIHDSIYVSSIQILYLYIYICIYIYMW